MKYETVVRISKRIGYLIERPWTSPRLDNALIAVATLLGVAWILLRTTNAA